MQVDARVRDLNLRKWLFIIYGRNLWKHRLKCTQAVVYTGFCVWGVVPGAWGGTFFIGEIKNFAFFQTRKFSKNAKKSMKIL